MPMLLLPFLLIGGIVGGAMISYAFSHGTGSTASTGLPLRRRVFVGYDAQGRPVYR